MVIVMSSKEFGQRVQQYRELRGYTQDIFSEMIGLTPNYLSGIERGVNFPRYDKLIAIMNALDVSADELFQDVIDNVYKAKAPLISDEISTLPVREQRRIFAVIDTMISEAKKGTDEN